MLFAEASIDQAQVIQDVLRRFCKASGQKLSLPKSRIYFSQNVLPEVQDQICAAIGIGGTTDLGKYLGMPTFTSRVSRETFNFLCEKIDRRLAGWKTKYLSLAGRITLAKSIVSSLAYYSMQTAKIPKIVCDDIDRKTRRFVWGGNEDTKKVHLIAWDALQRPKDQGGLGLHSASHANKAFMAKLGWRLLTEPNALWSRVLRTKYCKGRCDSDMFQPKTGASNVWNGIAENSNILCEGIRSAIGNGIKTLFWDHKWMSNTPLIDCVTQTPPTEIAGATVSEMWESGEGWKWEVFSSYLSEDSLKLIQAHVVMDDPEVEDLLYWDGDPKGKFSIKSAIRIIRKESTKFQDQLWNLVWKAPVQQRVRAFMWLVCHDRLLGNANRFKRKLTDDPKCFVCGDSVESTLHILRDCPAARSVWRKVEGFALDPNFFRLDLKKLDFFQSGI